MRNVQERESPESSLTQAEPGIKLRTSVLQVQSSTTFLLSQILISAIQHVCCIRKMSP